MHIFWEAKCQYTIIYFIVLIPYAFAGYQECARRLGGVLSDIAARKKVLKNEGVWKFAVLLGGDFGAFSLQRRFCDVYF